jgi:hypothetical protein
MEVTQEQIDNSIADATNVVEEVKKSTLTDKAGRILTQYSNEIQGLIDSFLKDRGAITKAQLNQLDEQIRLAKLKILEEKSRNTTVKYITYGGVIVLVFGVLWYLSNKKNVK